MDRHECMKRRAVFLDRDNTVIADPGYVNDPDVVQLLPGAADGIRALRDAGLAVVLVTNQSGLARGLITEDELGRVHDRVEQVLAEQGASVDAIYFCPYLEGTEATVARYRRRSTLRKPQPGMLLQAAADLDLSLDESWMVGDGERDVVAGARAGCRTILISGNGEPTHGADFVAPTLVEAARIIQEHMDVVMDEPSIIQGDPESGRADSADPGDRSDPADSADPVDPNDRTGHPADGDGPTPAGIRRHGTGGDGIHRDRTRGGGARGEGSEVAAILEDIRDQLRRRQRDDRHEDFSVARLLGTLTQMLALVAGVWGMMAVVNSKADALVRLSLAVFLQLVALTAFVAGRRT